MKDLRRWDADSGVTEGGWQDVGDPLGRAVELTELEARWRLCAVGDGGGGGEGDKTVLRPRPGGGGGGDKTVLRPRPGGRPVSAPAAATSRRSSESLEIVGSGLNTLVDAATALFAVVGQLRNTASYPDPEALRGHVAQQIQGFDKDAHLAGASADSVLIARYSLCTLIDETVLGTPWGMESRWSSESMLSAFHNETFGGEKFFQMLERASQEPARNLELLEFMFLCVALGLEGKYRVMERGRAQLEQVQDNLIRAIRSQRGDFERELSPHWRGAEGGPNRLARYVPLWAVAALAAALLTAIYLGFDYQLNQASDATFTKLAAIGRGAAPPAPAPPVKRTLTLREVLADDIKSGRVAVTERPEGSLVTIRGDGLFASGSARVTDAVVPVLVRIGRALDRFPGQILVTGHTDNTPLSLRMKVRFPSNWHLSQARAESVLTLLAAQLKDGSRLKAEGRGDTEPVASNATRAGRAKNRRVEVTLLTPALKS